MQIASVIQYIFWILRLGKFTVICTPDWQVTMISKPVFCENQSENGLSLVGAAFLRLVSHDQSRLDLSS